MSRWRSGLSRRGGRRGPGPDARRPAAGADNAGRLGSGGAPPVEDIDGILLVRSVEDDSFPLDALAEVARALSVDKDVVTVMVAPEAGDGASGGGHWSRLGALLDSLRLKGTRRVRLVMSGAGDDRPDRPCVARRIADAWEIEVIAPDATVLITPGGLLFVHEDSRPGCAWWRFAPGEAPRKLGPRAPVPAWQEAMGRVPSRTTGGCVVDQIPAGVLMRPADAPRPSPDDLSFAMPVDFERPTVLVGAPQAEDVTADEVAAVLAALPVAQRSRVRLAPGGRRDVLRLGQSVADMLGSEVEVLTGLPLLADHAPLGAAPRPTLVSTDRKSSWQPFVSSVACLPADAEGRTPAPRLVAGHPPDWISRGTDPGSLRLTDRWQATLTRAGLALWEQGGPRPPLAGLAVDPDACAIELGAPGQLLDESLLPALSRLLAGLGAEARSRATLLVRGRLTTGESELRRLAAEHGVAAIRYVTSGYAPRPGAVVPRPGTAQVPTQGAAPAARNTGTAVAGPSPAASPVRTAPGIAAPGVPPRAGAPGEEPAAPRSVIASGEHRPVAGPPAPSARLASSSGPTAREAAPHEAVAQAAGDPGVHTSAGFRSAPPEAARPAGEVAGDRASEAESGVRAGAGGVTGTGPLSHASGGTSIGRPTPGRGPGGAGVGAQAAPGHGGGTAPVSGDTSPGGSRAGEGAGREADEASESSGGERLAPKAASIARVEPERDSEGGTVVGASRPTPGYAETRAAGDRPDGGDGGERQELGPPERVPRRPARGDGDGAKEPGPDARVPVGPERSHCGEPERPEPEQPELKQPEPEQPGPRAYAAPERSARPDSVAAPAPLALPLSIMPGHVSSAAEREAFRDLAAEVWEGHAAAVSRVLTRMPALRGRELVEARSDLIAAHAYLTTEEGPLHHRELIRDLRTGEDRLLPYAGCLASALRRLPSYRGVALRGGDAAEPEPAVGTLVQEPAPVSALADSSELPAGSPVRYAIWSVTGRKVRQLLDRRAGTPQTHDEVVFVPGTGFRVLGVRTGPDDSSVVLLRELPGMTSAYMDGTEELTGLDLKALAHLEAALAKGFAVGGNGDWPERCTGPLGLGG
ncbi:hypothetical protein [Streptomyces sp. NPDC056468]|uniref:hypothetical protein n=1 Tax=Streptomyces sp. NPDC056468 TaxID=3345830 RepID=UPI00368DB6B4